MNPIGADLSKASLANADVPWATLTNANLAGANLKRASPLGADLSGTDLTGAFASSETKWPSGFISFLSGVIIWSTPTPSLG